MSEPQHKCCYDIDGRCGTCGGTQPHRELHRELSGQRRTIADLLEACKAVMQFATGDGLMTFAEAKSALELVEAAIAKAEGAGQ